jgi:hypothetical protein
LDSICESRISEVEKESERYIKLTRYGRIGEKTYEKYYKRKTLMKL